MYTCLIVEDEALARYAFRTFAARNFPDMDVIGEAESGREALEMFHAHTPDIVIMDIRIPGMNGLEVSREILKKKPDTKILILTAYENVDYLHQALDIGVSGYLLKPLNKEEAESKLRRVLKEIDGKNSQNQSDNHVETRLNAVRPYIEKELVSALAVGRYNAEEISSYIEFLRLRVDGGFFFLFSFEGEQALKKRQEAEAFVAEQMPRFKRCILGNAVGRTLAVLFPLEKGIQQSDTVKEALLIGQMMHRRILLNLHVHVRIGIGSPYIGLENLKASYDEAYQALHKASEDAPVQHAEALKAGTQTFLLSQQILEAEDRLAESLRLGQYDKAKDRTDTLIHLVFNHYGQTAELREYLAGLFSLLHRLLLSLSVQYSTMYNTDILKALDQMQTAEEIRRFSLTKIYSVLEALKNSRQDKETRSISTVCSYIDEKFCMDITLETAAEAVGLTPQYVSKLFKEEYGVNFIEYLTKKRLDYAKALLKSPSRSVKEISGMVGYVDPNYFCRLFKKQTGLSPKQYRLKMGR